MSDSSPRQPIVITCSTTTTSQWYNLDYRYGEMMERPFWVKASVGTSWTIQVGASAVTSGQDTVTYIVNVSSYVSGSAVDVLHGNWPVVRFVYSGVGQAELVMVV